MNLRLFVILAAAICIILSAFTATYVVVTTHKKDVVSPAIGDIDVENKIVYVGYGDLVYETADSVPVLGRAVDFFDEFSGSPEAVIVGLHYEAVSSSLTTGRFQVVVARDGKTVWVEPTWKVYNLQDGHILNVPLEDALEAAQSEG